MAVEEPDKQVVSVSAEEVFAGADDRGPCSSTSGVPSPLTNAPLAKTRPFAAFEFIDVDLPVAALHEQVGPVGVEEILTRADHRHASFEDERRAIAIGQSSARPRASVDVTDTATRR
jgi:hypothetical protein